MTCRHLTPVAIVASLWAALICPAQTQAQEQGRAAVHAFRIGALEAIALWDGMFRVPNSIDDDAVRVRETSDLLIAADLPGDHFDLDIQPLLIRDGDRVVLIDTGLGADGAMAASLAMADVLPEQVTDILISHAHGDHVGGLVTADGALAFPNAMIRMSASEWTFLRSRPHQAEMAVVIAERVRTFEAGSVVTPNITAVALGGHTPGHVGYEIASEGVSLLYIGDALHHHVLSVRRPDWTIPSDSDTALAAAGRAVLLERASREDLWLYAVHFPFPGLGRIQRRNGADVWVPEP